MARELNQRVAELEGTIASLGQRERRLRAVLSSALTSDDSRRDAREELESLLNMTDEVEDELLLLESPAETPKRSDDKRVNNNDR
jgi:hypothetical protein